MSDDTDKTKIIERIRKCLALGASPEPHEAAAALRQARKLMEKHGITESDVAISSVTESAATAGRSTHTPPAWLALLAGLIEDSFGVARYYNIKAFRPSEYVFVGVGPAPQIASYAFTVLRRKCTSARDLYYRSLRGRRASRVRRADAYAFGWVVAVESKLRDFAKQAPPEIVERYLRVRHPGLTKFRPIDRGSAAADHQHRWRGYVDGESVDLQHGVAGSATPQLGGDA